MSENPITKGTLSVCTIGLIDRVLDGKGRDVMRLPGGPQRLADCANSLKDVWFPLAHVPAMENRIERLEQLRKEAVARIPESGRYTDTPETARNEPEAAAEVAGDYLREPVAAGQGQIIREGDAPHETGRSGGDASCPDAEFQQAPAVASTPTLLRSEPAGEASAFRWSFDIENAPRGKDVPVTRQTKDGPVEGTTFKREIVILATKCGKVTQSYWIPDAARWAGLSANEQPVAWMEWPSFPAEALQSEAAIAASRNDTGLNMVTRHLNIAGAA